MPSPKRRIRRLFILARSGVGVKIAGFFAALILLSSLVVFLIERRINEGFLSFFDSLWWTIVTVSTVGYGDRLPQTIAGRSVAIITIFIGMAVMGTVTGRIASLLMERQMKEENGLLDHSREAGHFVICGWKEQMSRMLYELLDTNPGLTPVEMLLLNRAPVDAVAAVRNDPRLAGIKFVSGDHLEERDLVRAGGRRAVRFLVLADELTTGDIQHIDSRTVMAVMSIKNLNRSAYVCAELLDTKFEKYLQLSHCDEIVMSRNFNRSMLAAAASATGVSHVVHALLSGTAGATLSTRAVPEPFVGRTYGELREHFLHSGQDILIGLLENTGNILVRKREALREAQKNPDISKLIPELRQVKTLKANEPVINPSHDYLIRKYSRGIVVQGSTEPSAHKELVS
jgi:voltage-gated potassium channel